MSARRDPPPEVVVRFVRTEVYEDAVLASRAREVLGADEGAALARLRPEAARRDYLAAHALARTMLAELAGSDPARLRFGCPPRGRPELVAPPAARHLHFSISHADGIALCAVAAGCVVGADVESLRNVGPDPLGVAASVCSRREMDALAMLPASARAERLLSIWTAKEAVAKATGLGFRLPLPLIAVHEESNGPPAESGTGAAEEKTPWRLASFRLTPCHLAAVAVLAASSAHVALRFEVGALFCPGTAGPASWSRRGHLADAVAGKDPTSVPFFTGTS